jgi:hypothetical protein
MAENKILNIHQKLAEVGKLVDVLQKDKAVMAKFKYVTEESILSPLMLGIEQQKLALYSSVVPGTLQVSEQKYTKKKKLADGNIFEEPIHETVVSAEMIFKWVNLEDLSDTLEIPWVVVGQQSDASQAWGSGLTYCIRYFYLKFFHIATTESDPDEWRSKQSEVEEKQTQGNLLEVVAEITSLGKSFINGNDAKRIVFENFIKDNNKDKANYSAIKDINIAIGLRDKLKEFIEEKKEE